MKPMSRRLLATAMTVLCLMTAAVQAQVMDVVPSDALVVVKVKAIGETSAKLGKFLTDLGVASLQPGLDDPLKYLETQGKISQGIDHKGELAFVFRDAKVTGGPDDKSVLFLIPVTDFNAFVANFQGAKAEGDVTEVTMPHGGEPGYVGHWGNFAALSPSKEALTKPTTMIKMPAAVASKELTSKDVVLLANFAQLRAKFLPTFQANREKWLAEAEENIGKQAEMQKFVPVLKAVISQALMIAEGALRDTSAVTYSLNFGADGINLSSVAEFEPNTYAANVATQLKGTDQSLLKGLPSGKYLFFGGNVSDPKVSSKIIDDLTGPVVKEIAALGPEYKPALDYIDSLKSLVAANQGATAAMVTPTGALGQEAIVQYLSIAHGDVAAMKAAQQKMIKSQQETMKVFGVPADAYNTTITPGAKTVDGVTFDQMVTSMNPNANSPGAQQQAQVMGMLYGPGGMTQFSGDLGGNSLIIASGVPDATLSSVIAAAKAGQSPMNDNAGVKAVAGNLPKSRIAEFYVPVDEIVTTGLGYARQFGVPVNMQLPPDLQPIGATVATEGNAIRVDGYVPSSLVQSLVAAGMQVMMQMQGGGGGGGGGGL